MFPLSDVMKVGVAPNPDENAAFAAALEMKAHWIALDAVLVDGVAVNTTVCAAWPTSLVPAAEVEPVIPPDARLNFVLLVAAKGPPGLSRIVDWHAGSWIKAVDIHGLQETTRNYLNAWDPKWINKPLIVAAVEALPGLPPPPVVKDAVLVIPDAPAEPDWAKPTSQYPLTFGIRFGDNSPKGTEFESKEWGEWIKRIEASMFNSRQEGNGHWERVDTRDDNAAMQ